MFGPAIDETIVQYEGTGTTDRRFLSADERGSIISVTNTSGTLLGINRYDGSGAERAKRGQYGKPQSTNIGRFQYTGQKWIGEVNLYDYKFRMYAAHLGIFVQPDPIGYAGDGPNLYAYVLNDPVNFVDPFGLAGCPPAPDPIIQVCGRRLILGGSGAAGGGGGNPLYAPNVSKEAPQDDDRPAYCRGQLYRFASGMDKLGRAAQYAAWGAFFAAKGEQYSYMRTAYSRAALRAYTYIGYGRLAASSLKIIAGDRMSITDFAAESVIKFSGVDALGQAIGGSAQDFIASRIRPDPCR